MIHAADALPLLRYAAASLTPMLQRFSARRYSMCYIFAEFRLIAHFRLILEIFRRHASLPASPFAFISFAAMIRHAFFATPFALR